MSDYGLSGLSSPSSPATDSMTMDQKKRLVMEHLRSEVNLQQAQELISKMNEKCFSRCIPKPGYHFENSEKTCIAKCMDRYMEAWNVVSRAYMSRVKREGELDQPI